MIKNIVFDLDGTLLNTRQVDNLVVDELSINNGIPRSTTEKFYTLLKAYPFGDKVSTVYHRERLWKNALGEVRNKEVYCYQSWEKARKGIVRTVFALDWLLTDLTNAGFNIVIATSGDTYTQSMKLAWMNVNYPFFVFDKQANGFDKTDVVSWNTFFSLFDLGYDDTLVVGNSFEHDIEMPQILGRNVILAEWYEKSHPFQSSMEVKSFDNCDKFFDYCLTLKK